MPVYYNAHLEWFHKYLGGAPAPWDTPEDGLQPDRILKLKTL